MDKTEAEKLFRWAESLHRAGDNEEALDALGQLDSAFPDDTRVKLARAKCLEALGRREEALALCDDLAQNFGYERARVYAERLRHDERAWHAVAPSETVPNPTPAHTSHNPGLRPTRRRWLRATLLGAFGAVAASGAYGWTRYREQRLEAETEAAWERDKAAFAARERAKRAEAEAADALARTLPGYEHDREEWLLTATNGIPDWKPGIYRDVATLSRTDFTMDVYLPMAYGQEPGALFPCMTICWPSPHPGFVEMERWAEVNNVILVAMNDVQNGTFSRNAAVQDAVLETVAETLRVDRRMGIAFGMSGGANTSWKMLQRYPDNFAGVLMMGFSACEYGDLAPHIRVAYLFGTNDFNATHIRRCAQRLTQHRLPVQAIEFDGGHDVGPLHLREQLLRWLLEGARARA